MTAGEAIKMADELRPNNSFFGRDEAAVAAAGRQRLAAERGGAQRHRQRLRGARRGYFVGRGLEYDTPLLADGAAEALYPHWLAAQMDLALGETARAVNELQLYTSYVQEFAAWVRRKYMPVGSGRLMT